MNTEFVVWNLSFLLFDGLENLRIWALSSENCRLAQEPTLEPILGSIENVTAVDRILHVVEETGFDTMPERWSWSSGYEAGNFGRVGTATDLLYCDIQANRAIKELEAYRLAHRTRDEVPDGHQRGFNYTTMHDEWVGDDDIKNPLLEGTISGWTGNFPTDE